MDHTYPPEKRKALFNRGGLYFELKEDYSHALDCYAKGGDHAKVSEILIRNAELPGGGAEGDEGGKIGQPCKASYGVPYFFASISRRKLWRG